uniref:pelargonidin 3-O-(6-caffeoylglucoside) 5-O-(6-O-malonylglucoside) 4'''-malonyltransferase-like n=1 Tax=Erigeron canadensis TaxID=72917 RepID=UPI001CB8F50F|nr:pelargonidin 3-O-(6-caffeoylglucoside) 5-O-(6-O-malonylglucoside) 4'''-malonyltransferase-like [Erigeron canadensis]
MAIIIKVEKQFSKIIKPFVPTLPTLRHYKLGFIEEFVAFLKVGVVLFFSPVSDKHNPSQFFALQLEKSLEKTLTQFYPLAGRYIEENHMVDCSDQGVEFIWAKVNTTLQDFLSYKENDTTITDEFIPACNINHDLLLATQVTMFECGAVAIGVCATHMLFDASTLCTFIHEWAVMNRGEFIKTDQFTGAGFSSSCSLYTTRGLSPSPLMSVEMLTKYTRKKISLNESVISKIKAANGTRHKWSKVQLVAAIIWKAFICVDQKIYNYLRESVLIQSINLREKMASLIPKDSCGNIVGLFSTEAGVAETTEALTDLLSDSVRKTLTNYSKVYHDSEEGKTMVFDSFSQILNIPESTNAVILTSWCKFPFYEADFGFGKPIWAAPETITMINLTTLMDDAEGNGVEAYVFLETKDVPAFEEALYQVINDFAA